MDTKFYDLMAESLNDFESVQADSLRHWGSLTPIWVEIEWEVSGSLADLVQLERLHEEKTKKPPLR